MLCYNNDNKKGSFLGRSSLFCPYGRGLRFSWFPYAPCLFLNEEGAKKRFIITEIINKEGGNNNG